MCYTGLVFFIYMERQDDVESDIIYLAQGQVAVIKDFGIVKIPNLQSCIGVELHDKENKILACGHFDCEYGVDMGVEIMAEEVKELGGNMANMPCEFVGGDYGWGGFTGFSSKMDHALRTKLKEYGVTDFKPHNCYSVIRSNAYTATYDTQGGRTIVNDIDVGRGAMQEWGNQYSPHVIECVRARNACVQEIDAPDESVHHKQVARLMFSSTKGPYKANNSRY